MITTSFYQPIKQPIVKANSIAAKGIAPFCSAPTIAPIVFKGGTKNPNQIVVLSAECAPYAHSGGLGDVTRDMLESYKKKYPHKDIRLILPLYNASPEGPKKVGNKTVLEVFNKCNKLTQEPLRFELEDTAMESRFSYGVRPATAHLYKIKTPDTGVTTYAIYSPAFSTLKKEYTGSFYENNTGFAAFSFAAMSLLKEMASDSKESFNPAIMHAKDWHTAFSVHYLRDLASRDDFYKDIKVVQEILNANGNTQGKIEPLPALLNIFNPSEIQSVMEDFDFKADLTSLVAQNKDLFNLPPNVDVERFLADSHNLKKILQTVAEKFEPLMNRPNADLIKKELNHDIEKALPEKRWDENNDYNPFLWAIKDCDRWFTISNTHYKELVSDSTFSTQSFWQTLKENAEKGSGILNRIDVKRFNPNDSSQVYYPYTLDTYKEGKNKNKSFLLNQFSKDNIAQKSFDKKLINNPEKAKVFGYIDNASTQNPLLVAVGRFDTNQKGSDILIKSVKEILTADPSVRIVLAQPGATQDSSRLVDDFVKEITTNPDFAGRVVLVDSFVPVNEYVAAADFTMIPSRSETCGLVQYQSMRMGSIPIVGPTGGLNDAVSTIEENPDQARGFKAPISLMYSNNPVEDFTKTIKQALNMYHTDKEQLDKLIQNGMRYDSSWNSSVGLYNKIYADLAALYTDTAMIKRGK